MIREAKARTQGGNEINYYPTKQFSIPVDPAVVLQNGTVAPEDADKIVKQIEFDIDRNYVMKADPMILDLLAHITEAPDLFRGYCWFESV
ncbi:MAG: hypothetical protein IPN13_14620 [Bacteroidetes bacterium]|nr:hypothetical protein [Bacteroidota bacterium]